MKSNLIKSVFTPLAALGLFFPSCGNLEEINVNPNQVTYTNPGAMLDPVLYDLGRAGWLRYYNFTSQLMQFSASTGTGGVSRYVLSESAGDSSWNTFYLLLANILEMEKLAETVGSDNYRAISKTLKCCVSQLLVDSFGDVPMREACKGEEGIFQPVFDRQGDIYGYLVSELEEANLLFDESGELIYNASGEILYGAADNPVADWRRFCNSLSMRILLRTADVAGTNSLEKLNAMIADPVRYPVFESNGQAATIDISGTFPLEVPVARIRDYELSGSASKFYVDNLKEWNDPRLRVYYLENTEGEYMGLQSGDSDAPDYPVSALNTVMATAPMQFILMPYAEVEFIKAEAAWRRSDHTAAREAYEKGVAASIEQWTGEPAPEGYFDNMPAAYDGTFERIMLQKYYSLLYCDYQQWFEHLHTGLPELPRGDGIEPTALMPRRFRYPAGIQRSNADNYRQAVSSMGGDTFQVKLIWHR